MGNNPISLTDPDGGSTDDWYKPIGGDDSQIFWIEGSSEWAGLEHLGFNYSVTYSNDITYFWNGEDQSLYVGSGVSGNGYIDVNNMTFVKKYLNQFIYINNSNSSNNVFGYKIQHTTAENKYSFITEKYGDESSLTIT